MKRKTEHRKPWIQASHLLGLGMFFILVVTVVPGLIARTAGDLELARDLALESGPADLPSGNGPVPVDLAEDLQKPNQLALITTAPTKDSIQKALTAMGWGFDLYETPGFSTINLFPYRAVIVALDGGDIVKASIQNIANYANRGGNLIMLGGSDSEFFALAVDEYLLDIDETNFMWDLGDGNPDLWVTEPFHQLAKNLRPAHKFENSDATLYMIRSQDPEAEVVAINGDSFPALIKKKLGKGTLSWFISSPSEDYWSDMPDYDLLKQVIRNSLEASFPAPDGAPRGLAWALGTLWIVNSGDGKSSYGKKIYRVYPPKGAPIADFEPPGNGLPLGMTFDGTGFWHSDASRDRIYKLDPSDLRVISSFRSPRPDPADLAWDGRYLWASSYSANALLKIDPETGQEVCAIDSPVNGPFGLTWAGGYLYCGHWQYQNTTYSIYKIDPGSGSVMASLPAPGTYTAGLTFDGRYLWGSDWDSGRIYRIDIAEEPCECDLNHDGQCDMRDWLAFGEDWGRTDCLSQPPYCVPDQEQAVDESRYPFGPDLRRWQEFFPGGNRICRVKIEIERRGNPPGDLLMTIEDALGRILWSQVVPAASVPAGINWISAGVPGVKVKPGASHKLTVWSSESSPDSNEWYYWRSSKSGVYPGISSVGTLADFAFRTYKDAMCECDLNHDGRCDMQDWLLSGRDWGRSNCPKPEGFFEDFDYGEAPNWVDDGSGTWSIEDFALKMTGSSPASGTVRTSIYNEDFDDFTYQVDTVRTQGSVSDSQGMMFRGDGTDQNTYVFNISGDGYYLIYKRVNGSSTWLVPEWTSSSAICQGYDVWNTLKVVCSGSTMEFYINDILVESLVDSEFSSGKVGVKADDVSYEGNVKLFDNAELRLGNVLSRAAAEPGASIPTSLETSEEHR
jgi:hypothetical protein